MDVSSLSAKFQEVLKSFHFIVLVKKEITGWTSDSFISDEKKKSKTSVMIKLASKREKDFLQW